MSAWEFHVGQRVVCTKVGPWSFALDGEKYPEFGEIYTIRDIYWDRRGFNSIRLVEVINPPMRLDGTWEVGFDASRFRPLRERKTSIECFRALLNTTEKKVEA